MYPEFKKSLCLIHGRYKYKYLINIWDRVLVKVPRAQTHRTVQRVHGWQMGAPPLFWGGRLSGYNTEIKA